MQEEIRPLLENFIVQNWGRLVYDQIISACKEENSTLAQSDKNEPKISLPQVLSCVAALQKISFDDIIYAFGSFCFVHYAAQIPRSERLEAHPKQFLMSMHRLLSFEKSNDHFAHFHYIDCAPEELVMVYKTQQSFSSFVRGFVDGAAQSFAYHIECNPLEIREGEVSGCRFHLRFRGEV